MHRDIKPSNILLNFNDFTNKVTERSKEIIDLTEETVSCKISDFGLSKSVFEGVKNRTYAGTPLFISPEIAQRSNHDFKTDMWSFGITAYVILTGCFPFYSSSK